MPEEHNGSGEGCGVDGTPAPRKTEDRGPQCWEGVRDALSNLNNALPTLSPCNPLACE